MPLIRENKAPVVHGVLLAVLLVACLLSTFAGATHVPLGEMAQSSIVRLRLARIILAVVAGAGLSTAGVIFQALLRNPLAEPYVLGISSGAGLGAALTILWGWSVAGVWTLPGMAFAGALGTIVFIYALAKTGSGTVPAHTLLLAGAIINAVLNSVLMFLVSTASSEDLHNVVWWTLGNLQVFDGSLLRTVAIVVGAGLLVTVLLARDLNLLSLGEEPAAHLGLPVERTKKLLFVVSSLITGATVAACGLIGFVGLMVPHAMRLIVGPDHRRLLPASALAGAAFLVVADGLARTVMAPREIPIGVITAFLGGPFFLFLLKRRTFYLVRRPSDVSSRRF
jgi:iron complex transport system permease protein